MRRRIFWLLPAICLVSFVQAQDTSRADRILQFPDKIFSSLDNKARSVEAKIAEQTDRYLIRLQKQETRLKKKLSKKDTALARQLFGNIEERYKALKQGPTGTGENENLYMARLDSLRTALRLLQSKGMAASPDAQQLLSSYADLQNRLTISQQIRRQLQARQHELKERFEKLGMVKELRHFRKQVYYYQQQLKDLKEAFEDPSKLEQKFLELAMKMPEFRGFFANHSMLAGLFALPGGTGAAGMELAGLQTRSFVEQSLLDRFGSGPDASNMMQQSMQSAEGELGQLRNRFTSFNAGSYGNGEAGWPDFKPNTQRTKSFLQRLEYGANLQSQKAKYFFPVTSDLGLFLGYRFNDQASAGVGASYKLGWGNGWNNIRISHQGLGFRTYVDWKIRGSFYLSGGYEQNYRSLIRSVDQLRDHSAWQRSGLVGLSKRYTLNKKLKGELKLLWDFLSYQQVPKTQAFLFRIGYRLK